MFYEFYIEQAAEVLGIGWPALRRVQMAYGPKLFSLIESVSTNSRPPVMSTWSSPSAALRSARLNIVGSGIGSVPGRDFIKELPKLASAITGGAFDVRVRTLPLAEVEQAWTDAATTRDRDHAAEVARLVGSPA
ncbi:hypothetical protein ABZT47_24710 [Sphaerisporangium sp. NPDC005289]|uniref:hypothetical protein n=1 Tax=Sphaerisporangium sp. NPDC005289 TaxID=3155247 RepID=UPI0033AF091C